MQQVNAIEAQYPALSPQLRGALLLHACLHWNSKGYLRPTGIHTDFNGQPGLFALFSCYGTLDRYYTHGANGDGFCRRMWRINQKVRARLHPITQQAHQMLTQRELFATVVNPAAIELQMRPYRGRVRAHWRAIETQLQAIPQPIQQLQISLMHRYFGRALSQVFRYTLQQLLAGLNPQEVLQLLAQLGILLPAAPIAPAPAPAVHAPAAYAPAAHALPSLPQSQQSTTQVGDNTTSQQQPHQQQQQQQQQG